MKCLMIVISLRDELNGTRTEAKCSFDGDRAMWDAAVGDERDQRLSLTNEREIKVRGQLWALLILASRYKLFFVHCSTRSNACCRFSSELAMLKRRYPSPKAPKAVPESAATPA